MEERKYKYDAFISYRHNDLDKFVAENLHRLLETYELPKNIKEKLGITGRTINRVFRDQEELPLSSNLEDPIIDALENSKYLIVICSPRLKDSLWCKKEIETFKKLRGRKNIFCVLIEGEPSDSFPEAVLYDEEIVKGKKVKKLVEPLAADVRGENKSEVLKKLKEEKLRLIAPMYNLDYDDLRQRHKLRKQKQMLNIFMAVSIFFILFAVYTSVMLIKISSQQKMLKNHQALTLSEEARDYLKKDSRYNAIKSSYDALTKFNGVKMPYTPEAEYALSESLGVYNAGTSYKATSEIETKGVVDHVKNSKDYGYAAIYDESEELTLIDAKKIKKIITFSDVSDMSTNEDAFSFVGEDKFAYINKEGNIILTESKSGKKISEIKKESDHYLALKGSSDSNYIIYNTLNKFYIYSVKDNKVIFTKDAEDKYEREMYFSEDNKYAFVTTSNSSFDINAEDYLNIHVIDIENASEDNSVNLEAGYISGILTKGDNAYILVNRSVGTDMTEIALSYNYKSGSINWTKSYDGNWGKFITRSYPEGTNNVVVVSYDIVRVLNMDNGDLIQEFNTSSEILRILSYLNNELYLVINGDGSVNYLSMEYKDNIEYKGKFEFNLEAYIKAAPTEKGFLLVPLNENRVIYYEPNSNKELKEEDIKIDYPSDDSIKLSDYDKVKDEYNIKNRNLVNKIFYDTKKEVLFVNYTNEDLAVYRVKDKTLLNTLKGVGEVEHYFGKDKYNRIYIGDISNSYILDSNYNKVGHIKSLAKLDSKNNKVIISNSSKYYSLKIYTLNDLLKEAEKYLK